MSPKLVLAQVDNELIPLTPAVMYEATAAKYVKMDLGKFRWLVKTGKIPARMHEGRTRWIYLKEDLDTYLRNLPIVDASKGKIRTGEVPPRPPSLKEVSSGI
jgi:hypothetical protein